MGLGHFNHLIICELLSLSIVNKLHNLKVSSSMVKKVYLTWLLFSLFELAPSYQVLNVDVQLSCGLLFALLDVWQVLIPGMPVTGAFLKAAGKGLEYCVCIYLLVFFHLVLQGRSISQMPLCHQRTWCVWPCLQLECGQSQSPAPVSPCRRTRQWAFHQCSSVCGEVYLQVYCLPSWLTSHSTYLVVHIWEHISLWESHRAIKGQCHSTVASSLVIVDPQLQAKWRPSSLYPVTHPLPKSSIVAQFS